MTVSQLTVAIPDHNAFYSVYVDGLHSWKTYDQSKKATVLYYPQNAIVFLYYTYPTHRAACVIRNNDSDTGVLLPALSKKVTVLFHVRASIVDKLKRAAAFLNTHDGSGAFTHGDGFYIRLACILEQRGKLNYTAIRNVADHISPDKEL